MKVFEMLKDQFRRSTGEHKQLLRVGVEVEPDRDPVSVDRLGRFSDDYGPDGEVLPIRNRRGHYRFFNPEGDTADERAHNKARRKAYDRGEWEPLFMSVIADVSVCGVTQRIRSGGVAYDSDIAEAVFAELYAAERDELKQILLALGFAAGEVAELLATVANSRG